jgi:photosystem II stability/assembly factor-like uncharacterized protein
MTDDDLTERLAATLRAEASKVTSPPDAWEQFEASSRVVPIRPARRVPDRRRLWLTAPAGALGIAAAIALLVVVVRSGGSTNVKASSSMSASASAPAAAAAPASRFAAGPIAPPASSSGVSSSGGTSTGAGGAASGSGSATAVAPAPEAAAAAGGTGGPPGGPVPSGFQPVSVTFVSSQQGWALGTAPCSAPPCTSIVRTTDGGRTWVGIPAPRDGVAPSAEEANSGVSVIRFATPLDGWAYGPDLWATHDGGATWHKVSLPGSTPLDQVSDLEASAGTVQAAVLGQDGKVHVYSSPVGSDSWVAQAVDVQIGAGPVPVTQIVLNGSSGWLIENDRTVIGGARLVDGAWQAWTPPCATVEGPAVLAAWSPSDLIAVCDVGLWGGTSSPAERTFVSHDGGASFTELSGPAPSQVSLVAAGDPNFAVVAAGSSLYSSTDGGRTWTAAFAGQPTWSDLGFTTDVQGVVINGMPEGKAAKLLMTSDGGQSWTAVTF